MRQEDKVTECHRRDPKGAQQTGAAKRAQKTVTKHPATPEQVQVKQSQHKQAQLLRAAEAAPTTQPTQAQGTAGQKQTKLEARVTQKENDAQHQQRLRTAQNRN